MAKYVLRCIDDTDNTIGADVTYSFNAISVEDLKYHLDKFVRASGFECGVNINVNQQSSDHFKIFNSENISYMREPICGVCGRHVSEVCGRHGWPAV